MVEKEKNLRLVQYFSTNSRNFNTISLFKARKTSRGRPYYYGMILQDVTLFAGTFLSLYPYPGTPSDVKKRLQELAAVKQKAVEEEKAREAKRKAEYQAAEEKAKLEPPQPARLVFGPYTGDDEIYSEEGGVENE